MLMIPPTTIPTVVSIITKLATSIGPTIAKYAPIIIKTIGQNLPAFIKTIEGISLAADVLKPSEKVDELGAKAMAADKTPEDFDQINDYINYLRSDVKVDESTLSNDSIDVSVRRAIGTSIALKALGSELNTDISLPFLNKVCELGVESKVLLEIIKSYSESGLNPDDVEAYIDGELTLDERSKHSNALVDVYHNVYPSMTTQEVEQAIMKDF